MKNSQADVAFRELIKELRLTKGLTQAQLADRLRMPQSYVSKYETGERRLDFPETAIVCKAIGVPLKQFAELYMKRRGLRTGPDIPEESGGTI